MKETLFELKRILFDVKEKTGIEVRFFPRREGEKSCWIDYCGESFEVFSDSFEGDSQEKMKLLRYLLANADVKRLFPEKEEALKNILLGEGGEWYASRFQTKYVLPNGECYVIVLQMEKMLNEGLVHVVSCLGETKDMALFLDDSHCAVVKFSEKDQTPEEYATFLSLSLYEEMGIRASVGVGGEVQSFLQIALSYQQAATALRMSKLLHSQGEVHSYREYLLVRVLEEVPQPKLKEYFEQLQTGGENELFQNEELLGTAEAFLENSLNVSETSRSLYLHRNTLMYRLDKIERICGLNIRKFSDAISFRMITILYKLLNK